MRRRGYREFSTIALGLFIVISGVRFAVEIVFFVGYLLR